MAKYAYYDPESFIVLDWMDTELYNYPERKHLIEVTAQQWQEYANTNNRIWVNSETLSFITTPPPGNFYKLVKGEWAFDESQMLAVLSSVKKAKIQQIKAHRDGVTADYIIIDGNHFHSDANSRIQQLSLTRMGQAKQVPAGLMWQTKNNGLIELTNDIAAQFESVTMDHDMCLFANAQRHIAAVEALEDIQAAIDYDYSSGWQP
ncbi:TPA_asm: DUF4376 domain-containing protein [Salmonella enterica subsp. salamae serovar 42:z:1,5]|uniref:DUF4376 domain-containing protein n=4 Tax=Salmonella enterica TaxID=28901 RepID=A0A3I8G721_SALER|nr:DUF4376 domain-containing protein [Salmonella enterica]ECC9542714.1 DUF4376 domain-containing protein [Salmonella enterica subsp. salamae]MBA2989782.1 DUF4376 domain-containing protein [Salmonella enterica subsp. salamae serovar 47:z:e,n,x,z15]HAC6414202.1 DUF4376 domain-containing protein [Salmonella enterica subsp. salamae serovar 58:a:-]HAE7082899.1 DUF4376 domain-containing protein [Salmonella enterica subsp. salamae serovar 42:z:1,5]HAE8256998.1 DUF4376 domain-containing protein [Salmo